MSITREQLIEGFAAHLNSLRGLTAEACPEGKCEQFSAAVAEKVSSPEGAKEVVETAIEFICGNIKDNIDELFAIVTWVYSMVKK